MLVLVTGASGFLGSHIVERLKEQGHEVRCLVRRSSNVAFLEQQGVQLVYGAVDDKDSLPNAVRDVDAVIHSAGLVKARSAQEFDEVNHEGTRSLIEAAAANAPKLVRFLYVSSAAVMGPSKPNQPHTPKTDTNPVTMYGKSKLAGEHAVRQMKDTVPVTILRPPAIYGPRDQEMLAFFKMVNLGLAIKMGDGLKKISIVYGPDCADACVRAIEKDTPSGRVFFVEDGNEWTFDELATAIADGLGVRTWMRPKLPKFVLQVAAGISQRYGELSKKAVMFNRDKLNELTMDEFVCDSSDTQELLQWKPSMKFPDGAKITAKWYRENHWL